MPPLALLLAVALGPVAAASGGVRGAVITRIAPGDTGPRWPRWIGRSFDDSPVAYNPWAPTPRFPGLGDLVPVAPLDRLDGGRRASLGPFGPPASSGSDGAEAAHWSKPPDWVQPYAHPRPFPEEGPGRVDQGDPVVPLNDKRLVAATDRLRGGRYSVEPAAANYPLVAPADRLPRGPFAVSSADSLPENIGRYMDQLHERNVVRAQELRFGRALNRTDTDGDGVVSPEEFAAELQGRQNKTDTEASRLWDKYHTSSTTSMSGEEFRRLSLAGFDLGGIARNDVSSVMPVGSPVDRGFWGAGAVCPSDKYVTAARLKVQTIVVGRDNTGLNRVELRCSGGAGSPSEVTTTEGPEGDWTAWAECPAGQQAFSVRARADEFARGQDNTGLNGLELGCRQPDLGAFSRLRFGNGTARGLRAPEANVVIGAGPEASAGGWSTELPCAPSAAICGAQAHVVRDQGAGGDNMGVAELRVYCCAVPVDCSSACSASGDAPGCEACRAAAGMS